MKYKSFFVDGSSFRDPSGTVFWSGGSVFRQINLSYKNNYDHFVDSGLYKKLTQSGYMIEHCEVNQPIFTSINHYITIKPELIDFISYPYEWSFSQLKDAALLTLDIQFNAIEYGLTLKDASAYNIQFENGKPILIDTLSFQTYIEGKPWSAYRQFCQHFLGPLALMAKLHVNFSQLFRVFIDGVPLDMTSRLLPATTWLHWGLASHLHLHAKAQKAFADTRQASQINLPSSLAILSRKGLIGLVSSLRRTVEKLQWQPFNTEWGDYYRATNYTDSAFEEKRKIVQIFLKTAMPKRVWDMGANKGVFSRIASEMQIPTVAFDIDPAAVESNYRQVRTHNETSLLPLLLDLTNPSPSIGWSNNERHSLISRGPVDCIMALALIHHLAISNNIPLKMIAQFFARIGNWLIIEFVPKTDRHAQRLLRSREDIFSEYDQASFEQVFSIHFNIHKKINISGSERTLYLMRKI